MLKKISFYSAFAVPVATLLLLVIGYRLAFRHTLAVWQQHRELERQFAQAGNIDAPAGFLERKYENLSKVISLYSADTLQFRDQVIGSISGIAAKENVQLTDISQGDIDLGAGQLMVQKVVLEGSFRSLLQAYHRAVQTENTGLIRSATWRKPHPVSSTLKDSTLLLDLFIVSVKTGKIKFESQLK
jgi:hypothetical protein